MIHPGEATPLPGDFTIYHEFLYRQVADFLYPSSNYRVNRGWLAQIVYLAGDADSPRLGDYVELTRIAEINIHQPRTTNTTLSLHQDIQDIVESAGPSSRTHAFTFVQYADLELSAQETVIYTDSDGDEVVAVDSVGEMRESYTSTPIHIRRDAARHIEILPNLSPVDLAEFELLGTTIEDDKRARDLLAAFPILGGIKTALRKQLGVQLPR